MSRSLRVAEHHRGRQEYGAVACIAALAAWVPLGLSAVGPQRIVNNAVESTGALNESKPENSSLHGLVIDR